MGTVATAGDKIVACVDPEKCKGCGECVLVCSAGAMTIIDGEAWVDTSRCRGCGKCRDACPTGAISICMLSQLTKSQR